MTHFLSCPSATMETVVLVWSCLCCSTGQEQKPETKKAAEKLFLLLCTSVPLCFLSGQAVSTEQWTCHAAQWEGHDQHLALSCFVSGLFCSFSVHSWQLLQGHHMLRSLRGLRYRLAAAGLQQLLCYTVLGHLVWVYGWHAAD